MSEPTRQQIKEAFKKAIERWEKIVEDVGHYEITKCPLCLLFSDKPCSCNEHLCPIALCVKDSVCENTPFIEFRDDHTPANALAELNFLRKVYIWWMEKESKEIYEQWLRDNKVEKKQEKKEGRKVGYCQASPCKYLHLDGSCSFKEYCEHKPPEEKKEEWRNISTENLVVEIKDCGKSLGCYFVITDNDELRIIAKRECYIDKENHLHMKFNKSYSSKYNVIVENGNFRILKKT